MSRCSNSKKLLVIAGLMLGCAVAFGAFAAHGLTSMISPMRLQVFQTGVEYQFIHGLAVLACSILILSLNARDAQKYFYRAAICFIIGIFCFSGSLYALALTGIKWFGPITPIGGGLFLIGWGIFVVAALQIKEVEQ
jgi:uncharacterized membrane protein YgdD (TMEM256/DUF423 family)